MDVSEVWHSNILLEGNCYCVFKQVIACMVLQAVVKSNTHSSEKGLISTATLQNPWTDFDET